MWISDLFWGFQNQVGYQTIMKIFKISADQQQRVPNKRKVKTYILLLRKVRGKCY